MKSYLIVLLFFIPTTGWSSPINVGGTVLEIPNPPGFAELTPQMNTVYQLQRQLVAPNNEQFVAFIAESEIPRAIKNEVPDMERTFSVQTSKTLVGISVSSADFLKIKKFIKTENEEVFKKVEKEIPGLMDKANKGITKQFGVDLALSMSQMIPFPAHQETDRSLAYSIFIKYKANDESGKQISSVSVVTATFIHVKGKVLFLYASAEEGGLQWSRDISEQWSNAVIAANPSDVQSSVKEVIPSAVTGIDWGKVGANTLGGAIIGLVIGLIGWAVKRGKPN